MPHSKDVSKKQHCGCEMGIWVGWGDQTKKIGKVTIKLRYKLIPRVLHFGPTPGPIEANGNFADDLSETRI